MAFQSSLDDLLAADENISAGNNTPISSLESAALTTSFETRKNILTTFMKNQTSSSEEEEEETPKEDEQEQDLRLDEKVNYDRKKKSLGMLCKRFLELYQNRSQDQCIGLDHAAFYLGRNII